MRILGVDSATRCCSVAVVSDQDLLSEVIVDRTQTHSKHLMQTIRKSLTLAHTSLAMLDGIAVTCGPGSFTGLRIGISTVKGLARAIDIPLAGISSLHALAFQAAEPDTLLCPLIDARKNEVYHAAYRLIDSTLTALHSERVALPMVVLTRIDESCLFVGDGAVRYRDLIVGKLGFLARFASQRQHMIHASTIARLGLARIQAKDFDALDALVPRYIRKSDAEINLRIN